MYYIRLWFEKNVNAFYLEKGERGFTGQRGNNSKEMVGALVLLQGKNPWLICVVRQENQRNIDRVRWQRHE